MIKETWKRDLISIRTLVGNNTIVKPGWVRGHFAIHKPPESKSWMVIHIGTQCKVGSAKNKKGAVAMCDALEDSGIDWSLEEQSLRSPSNRNVAVTIIRGKQW